MRSANASALCVAICRCSGASCSTHSAASSSSRARMNAPNCSRHSRQVAARQLRQVRPQRFLYCVDQRRVPCHQDTGTRRMFGLSDEIGGDIVRGRHCRRQVPQPRSAPRCNRSPPGHRRNASQVRRKCCRDRQSCRRPASPQHHKRAPPPLERRPRDRLLARRVHGRPRASHCCKRRWVSAA